MSRQAPDCRALPAWVRAADASGLVLLVAGAWVAVLGGFRFAAIGIRVSVMSSWRVLLLAFVVLALRHTLVRRCPLHLRIWDAWRRLPRVGMSARVAGLFVGLTLVMTWPQVTGLSTHVAAHHDSFFNIWRLASIARHLWHDPVDLFEGNIFFPAARTLAYSDPVLLQGVLAGPLLWIGMDQVLAYNLLVLASFVLSGLGAFLLVQHLTRQATAGVLAGIIYAFGFYRIDHYMHLELLWGQWMPFALLALHRTLEQGRLRDGLYTGMFVALQTLSSIYYAIFFVTTIIATAPIILLTRARGIQVRTAGALLAGALFAITVATCYAQPLLANLDMTGGRAVDEVRRYSATAASYLAATADSVVYGWTQREFGGQETNLFPGLLPLALAALGVWPPTRHRLMYGVILAFSVSATLGFNGPLYEVLYTWIAPYRSLRVPTRFGVLVLLALAVLAGFGFARVMTWVSSTHLRRALPVCTAVLLLIELFSPPSLMRLPSGVPSAYRWLRQQPTGIVAELPMPLPHWFPRNDAIYQYLSTFHWHPLLNGYSGYYPPAYRTMLDALRDFPAGPWVDELLRRGAVYVIIHERFLDPAPYVTAVTILEGRGDLEWIGQFEDGWGRVQVYRALPNKSSPRAID